MYVMKWLILDEEIIRKISHRDGTIIMFACHRDVHHLSERGKEAGCVSVLTHNRSTTGS